MYTLRDATAMQHYQEAPEIETELNVDLWIHVFFFFLFSPICVFLIYCDCNYTARPENTLSGTLRQTNQEQPCTPVYPEKIPGRTMKERAFETAPF